MTLEDDSRIDRSKIAVLYEQYSGDILQFLQGILRDTDQADEVLQLTFTRLIEQGHQAREETIRGWIYRTAFREAMQRVRVRQRAQRARRQWTLRQSDSRGERPEDQLQRADLQARVQKALAALTPEQREVVHKRIYEDKKFAVIASELQLPLGTVLTRMRSALRRLSQELDAGD